MTIQRAMDSKVIHLTRTTYRLPKEKAVALEAFLKEHVKTKVLETKVEADGLTVTTTPETQKTVEMIVSLMTGVQAPVAQGWGEIGPKVEWREIKPIELKVNEKK